MFLGAQYYLDQIPGVVETTVGYTGGHTRHPTYEIVCSHATGHTEAVLVKFDPQKISYEVLVKHFFRMHDPTQLNRQGPDVGDEYRSAIFYTDKSQKDIAEKIKKIMQPSISGLIVTQIVPSSIFYRAEAYHQKFTQKTGQGMCRILYSPIE